jgi:hypothetical protein
MDSLGHDCRDTGFGRSLPLPDDIQLTFVGLSYYGLEWCVFFPSFIRAPVRGRRAH